MRHTVVVDLGYGDAGKGTTVDWLCASRDARLVVRFHGGAQAAHRVVTPDGREHVFSQFGSGAFTGAQTHLAAPMMVKPPNMLREAVALKELGVHNPLGTVTVDRACPITTEYHAAANRIREVNRGEYRHGSCGVGIGETQRVIQDRPDCAIYVEDCLDEQTLYDKLHWLQLHLTTLFDQELRNVPRLQDMVDQYRLWASLVRIVDMGWLHGKIRHQEAVFEGAQGVLLDEWFGFHPYTTWSTTTFEHADKIIADAGAEAFHLGVMRTYSTRHGPGPFPTYCPELTEALPDSANGDNKWQGPFRVGHLDIPSLRYATKVAGRIDGLMVTHLDKYQEVPTAVVHSYRDGGRTFHEIPKVSSFDFEAREEITEWLMQVETSKPVGAPTPDHIEFELDLPVVALSAGPTRDHKSPYRDLRT